MRRPPSRCPGRSTSWRLRLGFRIERPRRRGRRESGADGAPALDRLTYTRAVIDETMRLYPPAFAIARAVREPDEVAGVQVQPGDIMVISPWVLHRHRRHWTDPDVFDPERFMPGVPPVNRYA